MLQQVGTPLELYEQPANLFVAGFIGTPPMNFLAGHPRPTAAPRAGAKVRAAGARARCAAARARRARVVVGIRPEHLVPPAAPAARRPAPLCGQVEIVEPLGDEVVVHGAPARTRWHSRSTRTATPGGRARIELQLELDASTSSTPTTEQRLVA